jgi:hypothetical protein
MTRAIARFVWALLVWSRYEGMSLRPFGADGWTGDEPVRCDGGGKA